jgi:hypothetical protein
MGHRQYAVYTVRDEPARLRDQLDHIAAGGGRVVSVIWQPARQVTLEPGLSPYEVTSGYVIVSEHELPEPPIQLVLHAEPGTVANGGSRRGAAVANRDRKRRRWDAKRS